MVSDVKLYCGTCITCKRSKPNNQKPYGLLYPLAGPTEPWESIGVYFVGPLPLSRNWDGEFDSINYKAHDIAELMFEHIYTHHGLPKTIVSDHDVLFTSTFWGQLNTLKNVDKGNHQFKMMMTQMRTLYLWILHPKTRTSFSKLPVEVITQMSRCLTQMTMTRCLR